MSDIEVKHASISRGYYKGKLFFQKRAVYPPPSDIDPGDPENVPDPSYWHRLYNELWGILMRFRYSNIRVTKSDNVQWPAEWDKLHDLWQDWYTFYYYRWQVWWQLGRTAMGGGGPWEDDPEGYWREHYQTIRPSGTDYLVFPTVDWNLYFYEGELGYKPEYEDWYRNALFPWFFSWRRDQWTDKNPEFYPDAFRLWWIWDMETHNRLDVHYTDTAAFGAKTTPIDASRPLENYLNSILDRHSYENPNWAAINRILYYGEMFTESRVGGSTDSPSSTPAVPQSGQTIVELNNPVNEIDYT